jgi:type II secretion system protein G
VKDVVNLSAALDFFYRDTGRYPSADEGLPALVMPPPAANGWHGPYLKRVPTDPWGFPYYYQYPVQDDDGGVDFAVVSAGPDGKLGTADDIQGVSSVRITSRRGFIRPPPAARRQPPPSRTRGSDRAWRGGRTRIAGTVR